MTSPEGDQTVRPPSAAARDFLSGGGEMGARLRAFDWASSPLGPPEAWPQSLRTLVGLMLASTQPMFMAWGKQKTWLYNDAFIPILGLKHPAALGQHALETVWAEAKADLTPLFDRVFGGDPVHMADFGLMLDRHGRLEEAHFAFSYTPARDESGTVTGLFGACIETTERVLADRRQSEATARQRRLFQRAPGFISIVKGPDHVFEFVNDAYVRLLGDRDFIGRTVRQVAPEVEGQGYFELLDRVYATGERFVAHQNTIRIARTPGGPLEDRFLDFIYEPIVDEVGAVTGIFVEGHDVTDRARTDAALRESEARLRELNADLERQVIDRSAVGGRFWQLSPDLLGVLKPDAYFESVNPAWTNVLGWTEAEILGMPTFDLIHPDDAERARESFSRLKYDEPIPLRENRYRRKDGGYNWFAWAAVPLGDSYYCCGRDITAQKLAQSELASTQEALRQSQKMEAIGQLTGGIAHDFNNLLAGIGGALEMLEKRLTEGRLGGIERFIVAAQSSARRAATLTQRLLAFSRRQTLDPKPTDVNRLIGGMEDMIRRTVGPNIALEVVGAGGLWTTKIDPSELENALLNLCINARDAMSPHGGRLTVETANKWLDDRAAAQCELPPGQYIAVSVTDTGTGMTPDVIAKAFDPFFTTKPLGQGTGLGLSMIYGFVRQSGGQVRIYSEVGKGTTMCLYLPRHIGKADQADELEFEAALDPGAGESVLVIEDEPTLRMLIVEVLGETGYRAIEASDGPSGLKILQSDARIDLLITDVGLPGGMNGRQVADAARVTRSTLKVLFITGFAENAVVGNGHLEPGMELMTKPFVFEALAVKVRAMLER